MILIHKKRYKSVRTEVPYGEIDFVDATPVEEFALSQADDPERGAAGRQDMDP